MKDESVKWLDDNSRPDLTTMWFKNRAVQVRNFVGRVKDLAYSGLDDDMTPEAMLKTVNCMRRQANFVCLLATRAYEDRKGTWPYDNDSPSARMLRIEAQRAIDGMTADINEIAGMATLLSQLVATIDAQTSDPVGASAGGKGV